MAKKGQRGAAHFYAEIKGSESGSNPTRMSSLARGHWGHIRGWDCGGSVTMTQDDRNRDMAILYATKGSNNGARWEVARVTEHTVGRLTVEVFNPTTRQLVAEFII